MSKTNPFLWQKHLDMDEVKAEIEADYDYQRLENLIDNKHKNNDFEALTDAIYDVFDLIDGIAQNNYYSIYNRNLSDLILYL